MPAAAESTAPLRPIPALSGAVIDEAGVLDAREEAALDRELRQYPPVMQLQIWIVDTLGDEPIEGLALRAAETWKLGRKKEDKGALLLVAVKDRRMRIEVGYGLEGDLPDILTARVQDEILRPAFRKGDYAGGLFAASRQLYRLAGGDPAKLGGEPLVYRASARSIFWNHLDFWIFFLLFGFGLFSRLLGFFFGWPRYRRSWYGGWWGGGFGGGGGWSGGGGGGWSGGGGSFGGGGSSSSW